MTTSAPVRETENPYLNGNYAPVQEESTATDLDITGTIPDYLDGRYLRIGPNPLEDPDPARYHWFFGTGMAHGLRPGRDQLKLQPGLGASTASGLPTGFT
jgi:carotenoid cleavage dioxygenase